MPAKRLMHVRSRTAMTDLSAQFKKENLTVGFVPTMGALHNGHLSLIHAARARCDRVVASIFVNPTQFAPGEDFDAYPRDEAADLEKLEGAGCDVVYLPEADEMYPEGSVTDVRVPGLSDVLDGVYRPHFFYGVTTVVARLFLHVQPDVAVFGEKDYQQLQIIRRMVNDLGFPVEIIGAPTVRDRDGLAQSSRNRYLSAEDRRCAGAMQAALHRVRRRVTAGADVATACGEARNFLLAAGFSEVDYVDVVRSDTLASVSETQVTEPGKADLALSAADTGRVLGAAWIGTTRLIDNLPLH